MPNRERRTPVRSTEASTERQFEAYFRAVLWLYFLTVMSSSTMPELDVGVSVWVCLMERLFFT